jgi:hypothetical protein
VYLFRGFGVGLLWYNNLQFPVSEGSRDPFEFEGGGPSEEDHLRRSQATVWVVGLAPLFKQKQVVGSLGITWKLGFDGWTRFYGNKQYLGGEEGEDRGGRYSLIAEDAPRSKNFEDTALRYNHQELVGMELRPTNFEQVSLDVASFYENRYLPEYYWDQPEDDEPSYKYVAERFSFYRVRAQYEFLERWSATADFYHYHDGFYQKARRDDRRRFRNVISLSCKL